jgi:transposase, IS5 family
VLCAPGDKIRWLLRMIVKRGLDLLLCLLQASGLAGLLQRWVEIIGRKRLQSSDQR